MEYVLLATHFFLMLLGVIYLSSVGIVHCDLACRSVLVGEGKALKITDRPQT